MDITVERNAFGRQVDSFEIDLDVPCLVLRTGIKRWPPGSQHVRPFHAVFIRAPLIEAVHGDTQVLAASAGWAYRGGPAGTLAGDFVPPGADR